MSELSIVIPVMNQFRKCVEALASINTKHSWTPIIISQWDNPKPLSEAWNVGIAQASTSNYILVINDDILFSPWTIDGLIDTFESSSEEVVMVTGANCRGSCSVPHTMLHWPQPEDISTAESPDFSCFMIRGGDDFVGRVGLFDSNFIPAYF